MKHIVLVVRHHILNIAHSITPLSRIRRSTHKILLDQWHRQEVPRRVQHHTTMTKARIVRDVHHMIDHCLQHTATLASQTEASTTDIVLLVDVDELREGLQTTQQAPHTVGIDDGDLTKDGQLV